jgi:hypothetical protein
VKKDNNRRDTEITQKKAITAKARRRKGAQRKTGSEVLCGFSLRLRAFAVKVF